MRGANGHAGDGYGWLLDEVAVIAAAHREESELGAAAFVTHAVLSPLPRSARAAARLRRWSDGCAPEPASVFRKSLGDIEGAASFGRRLVLHEGFRVDPAQEAAEDLERLRGALGPRLRANSRDLWLRWGAKTTFRQRCAELLGSAALPPGSAYTVDSAVGLASFAERIGTCAQPRVVKFPGTGGTGNVVLRGGEEFRPALLDRCADGPDGTLPDGPVDVVVETWLPWRVSVSVSYLIVPEVGCVFLAACEQVVDWSRATFVGSSSSVRLSAADLDAVRSYVKPLFAVMAEDGYVGVAAVDLIIGTGWTGSGLELPSGSRVCCVECNPRMNRHNRVGLLVERLARTWGVPATRLSWRLTDRPGVAPSDDGPPEPARPPDRPPRPGETTTIDLVDTTRTMRLTVRLGDREGSHRAE
ncbi:hypothetical protein ABZ357_23880 [Streptomyces sp. NPDC005917]|uniref:hypothetical protein n=1 Tax=unclassified Streptomyces TaxID=2593676 RepID=UPI0033CBB827